MAGGMRLPGGRPLAATALVALAVAVGCAGGGGVPAVADLLARAPATVGADRDRLERGRRTYLTACARCHRPVPVARLRRDHLAETVAAMGDRAGLDSATRRDLLRYLELATEPGVRNPEGRKPSRER